MDLLPYSNISFMLKVARLAHKWVPHASVLRVGFVSRRLYQSAGKEKFGRDEIKIPTRKPDVWGTPLPFLDSFPQFFSSILFLTLATGHLSPVSLLVRLAEFPV